MEFSIQFDSIFCLRKLFKILKFIYSKDQIVCLEKQVNDRVDELDRIRNDLRKNETTVAEQAQTIQSILSERDTLNGLIQKLTKEKNQLEASHENLTQELNFSKDKLSAAQQSKEILKSQFTIVTDELEDAKKKQATDSITINELKEKLAQSDAEKSQLIEVSSCLVNFIYLFSIYLYFLFEF